MELTNNNRNWEAIYFLIVTDFIEEDMTLMKVPHCYIKIKEQSDLGT